MPAMGVAVLLVAALVLSPLASARNLPYFFTHQVDVREMQLGLRVGF